MRGGQDMRRDHRGTVPLLLGAALMACARVWAGDVQVSVNDRTGQPITMTVPAVHPVLPAPVNPPGEIWNDDLVRQYRARTPNPRLVENIRQDAAKARLDYFLFDSLLVGREKLCPPEQYTEALSMAVDALVAAKKDGLDARSEEHTSELQSR